MRKDIYERMKIMKQGETKPNYAEIIKAECIENIEVLKELAYGYKDSYITAHLLAEYNRITFVRLMALLNQEE